MAEEALCVLGCDGVERRPERLMQGVGGVGCDLAQPPLHLGPNWLDWVQIRRVIRKPPDPFTFGRAVLYVGVCGRDFRLQRIWALRNWRCAIGRRGTRWSARAGKCSGFSSRAAGSVRWRR